MRIIFLSIFVVCTVAATKTHCSSVFPLKETVNIVKEIAKKYGKVSRNIDSYGTEWLNVLLEEKKEGYKLNDTTYYLNDNHLPPENTYYFDQMMFLDEPTYVVTTEMLTSWKPSHPDETYLLSKISFACQDGDISCGLKCCPKENRFVQKAFINSVTNIYDLPEDASISHQGIKYSLVKHENATCFYHISLHDVMKRALLRSLTFEITVYFSCPPDHECCGFSCRSTTPDVSQRHPRSESVSSVDLVSDLVPWEIAIYTGIATVLLIAIIGIHYSLYQRRKERLAHSFSHFRESRDSKTGTDRKIRNPHESIPLSSSAPTFSEDAGEL